MLIRNIFVTLLVFILSGVAHTVLGQPEDNGPLLRKAVIEYQSLRFTNAIKELKKVLDKDPENVRAQEMMAGSNRNIKNYDEALYWYGELCKLNTIKPEWTLYYAEALANKKRYEESEQWYRKFLSMKPNDRRAKAFSKADLNALMSKAGEYEVIYSSINTDASEYSPMYYRDGLLFVSNRQQTSRFIFQWDRTSYSDLYVIDDLSNITASHPDSLGSSQYKTTKYVASQHDGSSFLSVFGSPEANKGNSEEPYLLRGKVKSNFHEGPAVLLPEGSLMFTRNNYAQGKARRSRNGINKLKLYTASGTGWNKITSFPYNNDEYSTGHPAISTDGKILVFASDMPRGFGGTDLYYSVRTGEGKEWGRPVNLGPKINTEGNEQFPYLDNGGKLYFSSTGHPGFGGLDIFEVVLKEMKAVSPVRNMGPDINSSSDDFGIITDDTGKTGFFSSNRRGNDDIYQFNKTAYTVTLKGKVVDIANNRPLVGATVVLSHNGILDTLPVNSEGEFTKALVKEMDYELDGSWLSYVNRREFVTSTGISTDSTINVILRLKKNENPQQWVLDNCESLKKTFSLQNIYYDLDKDEIRPDAWPVLDDIAATMIRHPEIRIITASHTDSRATDSYNRDLSLRRGEAAKAYLVSMGIDGNRIEVKYYGKSRLLNACTDGVVCPESEQQVNRRTEFEVIINGVNLTQINCR